MNGRSWRRVLSGIRSSPGLFVVCSAAVSVAVFLVGAFAWAGLQSARWSEQLSGGRTIVIYFDQATEKVAAEIREERYLLRTRLFTIGLITFIAIGIGGPLLVGAGLRPLRALSSFSARFA